MLEKASVDKRTVRVMGGGYSCNGINCTDDYMISLKNMNKIIQVVHNNSTRFSSACHEDFFSDMYGVTFFVLHRIVQRISKRLMRKMVPFGHKKAANV